MTVKVSVVTLTGVNGANGVFFPVTVNASVVMVTGEKVRTAGVFPVTVSVSVVTVNGGCGAGRGSTGISGGFGDLRLALSRPWSGTCLAFGCYWISSISSAAWLFTEEHSLARGRISTEYVVFCPCGKESVMSLITKRLPGAPRVVDQMG